MNTVVRRSVPLLAGACALAVMWACGDAVTGPGTAHVKVLVTDQPSDYLAQAWVCVSSVYLQPSDDDVVDGEGTGRVVLWEKQPEGEDQCFDLLTLQDGLTAPVTQEVEIPAVTYHQLRFVVESAEVTLLEPWTFENETDTDVLHVPSGYSSGIKVQLLTPLVTEEETLTEVTVDLDVDQNFVMQGNPSPEGVVKSFLFTPHLVEVEREVTTPEG